LPINISEALDILAQYDIHPEHKVRDVPTPDLPDVGTITDDESIYNTGEMGDIVEEDLIDHDDRRIREWLHELQNIAEASLLETPGQISQEDGRPSVDRQSKKSNGREGPPEPACAWYCPMHYFGADWGIYIRENCMLHVARDVAIIMGRRGLIKPMPVARLATQALRAGFYALFLHEQFHHKVESAGFRMLINSKTDRYRPYKTKVYGPTYLTVDCLEESLANAESYRRLEEPRYKNRLDPETREGLEEYLLYAFARQPSGYREALNYLPDGTFYPGVRELQSRMLDAKWPATTPADHWNLATYQLRALMNIDDEIYVIMPRGAKPLFTPKFIDPGVIISSSAAIKGLRGQGYCIKPGYGKGSHVRLEKPNAPSITIPGNRDALSLPVLKSIQKALGDGVRLPDLRAILSG
jgi:predicted RNA binding protein YcfA (HicA-like mRNA interferase family)